MPNVYPSSTLNFTVHDATGLLDIGIDATFAGLGRTERIYEDGAFLAPYLTSTINNVDPNNPVFAVRRDPGWPETFTFEVSAIDVDTNVVLLSDTFTLIQSVTIPPFPVPAPATSADDRYDALFQSVGDAQRGEVGSLVEKWRMARATGVATYLLDEKAFQQAFPNRATDFLPVYEALLGLNPSADETDDERRTAAAVAWVRAPDSANPTLQALLQSIDANFVILDIPHELLTETMGGVRAFEDWNPADPQASGPAFNNYNLGGYNAVALLPNYSGELILYVMLDGIAPGASPTAQQSLSLQLARDTLNETLPAWVDHRIFAAAGFVLDQDHLDITAFADGDSYP